MGRVSSIHFWATSGVLAFAFPFLAQNDYHLTVMTSAFVAAIATLGLNLIVAHAGQFNLAHGSFVAVGAYTMGLLTVDYHVPFWLALALSGVVPTVLAWPVGIVSLRLTGHYFSIFTLCIGVIVSLVIEKWESLTHGAVGVMGIPGPGGMGPFEPDSPRALYYYALFFLAVALLAMKRITASLLGRDFDAVRNDPRLAQALGIALQRTKQKAFAVSVFYAGLAGGLYASVIRFIGPGIADVEHTFEMTMFMLVGGAGTLLGPVLGTLLMTWLAQALQQLQEYRYLVFGPLLILLVIHLPQGIVGYFLLRLARRGASGPRARATPRDRAGPPSGDHRTGVIDA